ncbi:MAG: hypothetical protein ACR2RE_30610, partial [Geminicoccaceae bacterium]
IQETILAVSPRPPEVVQSRAAAPLERSGARQHSPAQKVDLALANVNSAQSWLESASRELRAKPEP